MFLQNLMPRQARSSSVDEWDIGRKRDISGGVEFLVYMKEAGDCSV